MGAGGKSVEILRTGEGKLLFSGFLIGGAGNKHMQEVVWPFLELKFIQQSITEENFVYLNF